MDLFALMEQYKYLLIIVVILAFVFGSQSTCNGVTGYGPCSTDNGKVTHYSPLNLL